MRWIVIKLLVSVHAILLLARIGLTLTPPERCPRTRTPTACSPAATMHPPLFLVLATLAAVSVPDTALRIRCRANAGPRPTTQAACPPAPWRATGRGPTACPPGPPLRPRRLRRPRVLSRRRRRRRPRRPSARQRRRSRVRARRRRRRRRRRPAATTSTRSRPAPRRRRPTARPCWARPVWGYWSPAGWFWRCCRAGTLGGGGNRLPSKEGRVA